MRSFFALTLSAASAAALAQVGSVSYIGSQTISTGFQYGPSVVGGLSGIDYDAASGAYYIQSDARTTSDGAGAYGRFYTATIGSLASGTLGAGSVQLTGVKSLKQPGGAAFANLGLDAESIRFQGGKLWVSSEGDVDPASNVQDPFVRSYDLDGNHLGALPIPSKFQAAGAPGAQGIRDNLAFESLAFSPDGKSLYTATESSLRNDGVVASFASGAKARILRYDLTTGLAAQEYLYNVERLAEDPAGSFGVNGLVELLAVDDRRMLALERSFSLGAGNGNSIKIYEIDLSGATDISGRASVENPFGVTPVSKRLVADLNALSGLSTAAMDNVEGMTWGPTLADGSRTLVLVSDNNFNSTPGTQFFALKVAPVPEPGTLAALGLGAAALLRKRRRG